MSLLPLPAASEPPAFEATEARACALGRTLVADHGVRLTHLLFDADEVLWDWLMDFAEMVRRARWRWGQGGWDMSHREWVQPRPGMLGLLWGLHLECRARGLDARLRIWTNGYPYRLRAILDGIPAFWPLLGLPDQKEETLARAPNVVFRGDYNTALAALLDPAQREAWLATAPDGTRRVLASHLRRRPFDPNLKLPPLASLAGKPDLGAARVLVDDTLGNVIRFARAGGRGVHLATPAPAVMGRRVPNTVWRAPLRALPGLAVDLTPDLGEALRRLAPLPTAAPTGELEWIRIRRWANGAPPVARGQAAPERHWFTIGIPDDRVRAQWIGPRNALRALLGDAGTRESLAHALWPEATP